MSELQTQLLRLENNFNTLFAMNDRLTKIVDEKEAWLNEMVEALKEIHPHIANDDLRAKCGNLIVKFEVKK
jgi:chaperonin cofactor prefoldin